MKTSYFKNNRAVYYVAVICSFIIMSAFFVAPFWHRNIIYFGDDLPYHIMRITEMAANLRSGHLFTWIYTNTQQFGRIGFPLNLFYPWITTFPFAILFNIFHNPVHAIYFGFMLYAFLAFVIMYLASYKFSQSRLVAYVSSVLYVFSNYFAINTYTRFDIGEFVSMVFLPIAFYGFYAVLAGNYRDWKYLSIGLSLIMLSHVLTTWICINAFVLLTLILWWFVNDKKKRLLSLAKSIGLFILCTAVFVFPFLEQELYQAFELPTQYDFGKTAGSLSDTLMQSLNNNMLNYVDKNSYNIGLSMLVIFFVGIFVYRKLSVKVKGVFLVGAITFICSTSVFPWFLMNHSPLKPIQYPTRLFTISTLCLALVGGYLFKIYIGNQRRLVKYSVILLAILTVQAVWLSSVNRFENSANSYRIWHYTPENRESGIWGPMYIEQYTPQRGQKYLKGVVKHQARLDGHTVSLKNKQVISRPNAIEYVLPKMKDKSQNVDLPMFSYRNIQAFASDGQHLQSWVSARGTVEVKLPNHNNRVVLKYVPSIIDIFSIAISLLTWVLLIVQGAWRALISRKNINNVTN